MELSTVLLVEKGRQVEISVLVDFFELPQDDQSIRQPGHCGNDTGGTQSMLLEGPNQETTNGGPLVLEIGGGIGREKGPQFLQNR